MLSFNPFQPAAIFHIFCIAIGGIVLYLDFSSFLLLLTLFIFWEEDWTREFWDFRNSYVVWKLANQLTFTIFINNNHFPFHLL